MVSKYTSPHGAHLPGDFVTDVWPMIHHGGPKGVTRGVSAQRYSVENDPVPVPRRAPDPVIDGRKITPISRMK